MNEAESKVNCTPLAVGPGNCVAVTGLPWRHVRDHYRALAVRVGRKLVIPSTPLLAALERDFRAENDAPLTSEDAAERVRALVRGAR